MNTRSNTDSDDKIVCFILTHGRPEKVYTYNTLKRCGFSGDIYIIIDDEDKSRDEYINKFGDKVVIFSKEQIAKKFDECDNFGDRRSIVYARNACFEIAENMGIKYFMQLDDDYTEFKFSTDQYGNYKTNNIRIKNLDIIFNILLKYYKVIPAKSIAIAQGGDFIGGENSNVFKKGVSRKAMNSFICSTERPFYFTGRINEDVNTYTWFQGLGNLFFTTALLRLEQKPTQANSGGMTELYLDSGTYVKSFYTVMLAPSSTKIAPMGFKHKRLHHKILWNNAVPLILNESYKK